MDCCVGQDGIAMVLCGLVHLDIACASHSTEQRLSWHTCWCSHKVEAVTVSKHSSIYVMTSVCKSEIYSLEVTRASTTNAQCFHSLGLPDVAVPSLCL